MRMLKLVFLLLFISTLSFGQNSGFEAGVTQYENKNYQEAAVFFNSVKKNSDNYYKSQEYLGDIAAQKKKWDKALNYYENLLEKFPNNANYHFKYGGALGLKAIELSRVEALFYISDIKKHLNRAAQLDKQHIEARWALIELYLKLPAVLGGSSETATNYADELLEISEVDGWLAKGKIALEEEDYQASENYYKKAIKVGQSVTTYRKLLQLYKVSDQIEKQEKWQQVAAKKHPQIDWTNI